MRWWHKFRLWLIHREVNKLTRAALKNNIGEPKQPRV